MNKSSRADSSLLDLPNSWNGGHVSFSVGDKVIYPNHGLGVVEKVEEKTILGTTCGFFHLRILSNDTTVLVPVANVDNVGLRRAIDDEEVERLFGKLGDGKIDNHANWKGRFKDNSDKMRSGSIADMADVLKSLTFLAKSKSLSFREKRMLDRAKSLIVSEVSEVMRVTPSEIEERVEKALERCFTTKARNAQRAETAGQRKGRLRRRPRRSRPPRRKAVRGQGASGARRRNLDARRRLTLECPVRTRSAPGIRVSARARCADRSSVPEVVSTAIAAVRSLAPTSWRRPTSPWPAPSACSSRCRSSGRVCSTSSATAACGWRSAPPASATGSPAATTFPPGQAVVFCANHQSNVDPPVLYRALHRRLHVLFKAELRKLPILGMVMETGGFVPVERGRRDEALASIDIAAASIRAGNSFLIFPEGTRSRTDELLPFKKGGFIMAIKAQAPIVPVAVTGGRAAMRKGSAIVRPVTVSGPDRRAGAPPPG